MWNSILVLHYVPQNVFFNYNFNKDYHTLIIFGTNIPQTTGNQMTIQFSTSLNVCFALPGENITNEILLFYQMQYDYFINITHKNIFCSHFWYFGWDYIQLSIFRLSIVKLLEMSAHYANTTMKTLTPFIDHSIDNVLLQTNPIHFLTSQTFPNITW